jgi:tRNA-2-methylthio-N6-dimethylallyladenosine synthase
MTMSGTSEEPQPRLRLHVRTYGCQMNVYDGERMAALLASRGYGQTDDPAEADLILLNTCHIREKAAEKVYSEIGRLRAIKAARPETVIGVAGCVAQAEGAEMLRRAPAIDLVVGPQAYHRLPEMLDRVARGERPVETDFPPEDKFDHLPDDGRPRRSATAFLTVQEGCDKFCTFCVVPYTRGAETSRPAARILAEAERLVARGVREITLLGQNVNAYHGAAETGDIGLAGLIRRLAAIDGLERIRYTTSHPADMDDDLIAAHAEEPKLMPYLHLPVQAGSDRILKAMNRRHSAESYLRLVERIRAARPDIALSGDFIVGFPGESEDDFRATLDLVAAVGYAQAFSFKYSPRPGTPAAARDGQIPEPVKAERLARLQARLAESQEAFLRGCIGRVLPVLVDKPGREPGQMTGRSPYLQPVHFSGEPALLGRILPVRIRAAGRNSLAGDLAA